MHKPNSDAPSFFQWWVCISSPLLQLALLSSVLLKAFRGSKQSKLLPSLPSLKGWWVVYRQGRRKQKALVKGRGRKAQRRNSPSQLLAKGVSRRNLSHSWSVPAVLCFQPSPRRLGVDSLLSYLWSAWFNPISSIFHLPLQTVPAPQQKRDGSDFHFHPSKPSLSPIPIPRKENISSLASSKRHMSHVSTWCKAILLDSCALLRTLQPHRSTLYHYE